MSIRYYDRAVCVRAPRIEFHDQLSNKALVATSETVTPSLQETFVAPIAGWGTKLGGTLFDTR